MGVWGVESRKWEVGSGKWEVGSGKWGCDDMQGFLSCAPSFKIRHRYAPSDIPPLMAHRLPNPAFLSNPTILLVKTSSLGDVLHNLPVASDIARHYPDAQIDWVVEESFAALPRLHPAVRNVIPVAVRRWRSKLLSAAAWREITAFRNTLAAQRYDIAIDTQGLLKSALLMRGAQGLRCGFDRHSAREPLAASLYQRTFSVATGQHAVERNRQLAAQAPRHTLAGGAHYSLLP